MNLPRSVGHAVAIFVGAYFLVCGLCGAMCSVAVCVEDCDPCVEQCQCHRCDRQLLDNRASHLLTKYRLSIDRDAAGVERTMSDIFGLSLDLADGPREHGAADFVRFAGGVIEMNGFLLQPQHGTWTPGAVDVFESAVVVGWKRKDGGASLEFLFDRGGTLLEIHEVRR